MLTKNPVYYFYFYSQTTNTGTLTLFNFCNKKYSNNQNTKFNWVVNTETKNVVSFICYRIRVKSGVKILDAMASSSNWIVESEVNQRYTGGTFTARCKDPSRPMQPGYEKKVHRFIYSNPTTLFLLFRHILFYPTLIFTLGLSDDCSYIDTNKKCKCEPTWEVSFL